MTLKQEQSTESYWNISIPNTSQGNSFHLFQLLPIINFLAPRSS